MLHGEKIASTIPMEQFNPLSDLDRAIVAAHRSPSALPELCRQLCQGELFLLIPHHPEFGQDDQLELRNGMELPFVIQPEGEGEVVLIFSSEERAQEGMRRGKVPPGTYRVVSMSAIQALEVLGKVGLRALVNKCCAMPQLILPPELMRDIASGKVFHSSNVTAREIEEVALRLLDPADYPTDLIQPVFEILRKHRQFRAAWIFTYPPTATDSVARRCYHFILLMDPFDDNVYNEFNLVVAASHGPEVEVYHSTIDESDPVYAAKFFRRAHPFYVAADFACSTES